MMESFSPLGRRLIALGLLFLLLLMGAVWIVAPLLAADEAALMDLADVRHSLVRVQAQAAGPDPPAIAPFPSQIAIQAMNRKKAGEALGGQLAALAVKCHVELQLLPGAGGQASAPSLITMGLSAVGPRDDLVRFINALETGAPAIRFRRFHIGRVELQQQPMPSGPMVGVNNPATADRVATPVRLDAEVVAFWIDAR